MKDFFIHFLRLLISDLFYLLDLFDLPLIKISSYWFLSGFSLDFFGNGILGAMSCPSCRTSCIYRAPCHSLHIFLFLSVFWENATTSDVGCLTTRFLVYLYKRWRVIYSFLVIWSSPVLKFFWILVFNFLCCLPLWLRKMHDKYISSASYLTSYCSLAEISS